MTSSVTIKPEKVMTEEELFWTDRSKKSLEGQKGMTILIRTNEHLVVAFSLTEDAIDAAASALQGWMDTQELKDDNLLAAILAHSVMIVREGKGQPDVGQRLSTILLAAARLGRTAQYQCRLGDAVETADVAIINPEDMTVTYHAAVKQHAIN